MATVSLKVTTPAGRKYDFNLILKGKLAIEFLSRLLNASVLWKVLLLRNCTKQFCEENISRASEKGVSNGLSLFICRISLSCFCQVTVAGVTSKASGFAP